MKQLRLLILSLLVMLFGCTTTTPPNILPPLPSDLNGVNLAGAEFSWDANTTPVLNSNYTWVSHQDLDYLVSKNVSFGRLLFSWEILQENLNSPFNTTYFNTLIDRVTYATSKGMYVMIEPHPALSPKFARYKGNVIGSAQVPNSAFADLWVRLANQFKANPKVIFGLMNEPNNIGTMQWFTAAQAAITGIRNTGSSNIIMIEGNGWSQPGAWNDTWYDTSATKVSNATGWATLNDPLKRSVVSVHAYFDAGGSGANDDIANPDILAQRLQPVVTWARAKGLKVHLSEFGANAANPAAQLAVNNALKYIDANKDVLLGWSWWAYGPPAWWGNYHFTLSPSANYTVDNVKFSWLKPYLKPIVVDSSVPTPVVSPTKPTAQIAFSKNTVFTTVTGGITSWVYVPNSYDSSHNTQTQLFVWLHGCGGQSQYDISLVSFVDNQKWISLAPGGREKACWSSLSVDGPAILAAIQDLKTHFNIDPTRVVIGGYSSGGDIGYPLAFQNSNLFAGALFENTGPSTSALSLSKTATNKFNIVQLSHVSDTTYPIATIRSNMNLLKTNGFPVTLLERPGTHWDNDNGATGTQYDLRTLLLPYLNLNWSSTGSLDAGVADSGLKDSGATDSGAKDSGVVDSGVKDAGVADSGVVDSGLALTLKPVVRITSNWGTGYCEEVDLVNKNSVSLTWSKIDINLRGGTIRDLNSKGYPWDTWGADVSSRTGVMTVIPLSWNKMVLPNSKATFGFCADFGPLNWTGTIVLGSLVTK